MVAADSRTEADSAEAAEALATVVGAAAAATAADAGQHLLADDLNHEAAQECSPRRKPWAASRHDDWPQPGERTSPAYKH